MAQKRKRHQTQEKQAAQGAPRLGRVPNAPTIFRVKVFDAVSYDLIVNATQKLKPLLWLRDGGNVKTIRSAETPEELLEMIPLATGLALDAWHQSMRAFGAQALPLIGARLKETRALKDGELRDITYDLLVGELRWRGQAGAKVLLDSFDHLDEYGKSLASVALGLLGASQGADKIWSYYQKIVRVRKEDLFVGALWGLIDFGDLRAADALYEHLVRQRYFTELMGFLSLAGDQRALVPLLVLIPELDEDERWSPLLAASGIAHRIGREAVFAELRQRAPAEEDDEALEGVVERLMSHSLHDVEEYFALYYRGFTLDDVSGTLVDEI